MRAQPLVRDTTTSTKMDNGKERRAVDLCMIIGFVLMLIALWLLIFQKQMAFMYVIGGLSIFIVTIYWKVEDDES